jgi:hypothetical protein
MPKKPPTKRPRHLHAVPPQAPPDGTASAFLDQLTATATATATAMAQTVVEQLLVQASHACEAEDWDTLDQRLLAVREHLGPEEVARMSATCGGVYMALRAIAFKHDAHVWKAKAFKALDRAASLRDSLEGAVCRCETYENAMDAIEGTVVRLHESLGAAGAPDPTVAEVCAMLLAALDEARPRSDLGLAEAEDEEETNDAPPDAEEPTP